MAVSCLSARVHPSASMCAGEWRPYMLVSSHVQANTGCMRQAATATRATGCDSLWQAGKHKLPGRELAFARKQPARCLLPLLLLRSYNQHLGHQGKGPRQEAVPSCLPQLPSCLPQLPYPLLTVQAPGAGMHALLIYTSAVYTYIYIYIYIYTMMTHMT